MNKLLKTTAVSVFTLGVALSSATANGHHRHSKNSEIHALKAQVDALTKRLNELETQKHTKQLTDKEAVTTTNNNTLKISGQVNRAVLWHDNGKNSNFSHVDNDNSSTRINVNGEGKVNANTVVGGEVEFELLSNSSNTVDVHHTGSSSSSENIINIRVADFYAKSARWGDIIWGRGKMASDCTMEDTDFSSTRVVADGTSVFNMAGGTRFFDKTSQMKSNDVTGTADQLRVKNVFDSADGLSRQDRIRYNTPQFEGFSLQTSHGYRHKGDKWDVALKYAGETMGTKLAAQVAYVRQGDSGDSHLALAGINKKYKQVNGSIGALFPVGISVMVAAAHRDWHAKQTKNGSIYFGKLGYQNRFFEAGVTAFSLDYGQFTNMTPLSAMENTQKLRYRGKSYGAFMVQHMDRIATEIYLGARVYKLDAPTTQAPRYKDITAVMFGGRIKF